MTRLTLLRHGETRQPGCYLGRSDPRLSARGYAQMRAATRDGRWARVLSSPRRRCAAFARAYAAAHGLPLAFDERLAELDFGDWDGVPVAALHAREPQALAAFWRDPLAHPPPRGETLPALAARVLAALADVAALGADALLVTHGGPLRIACARRDGLALSALSQIEVPHGACLAFDAHAATDGLRLAACAPPPVVAAP
ncbi:histidine phosphatase family protein [Solimonas flava]|uniref:histidine phosphatase family protein n=1 Tax=Solimonas flava TaxID=415849 RepID=UPI00041D09B2|nr:histidine phosphatase family protein [Solimonas flava]